MTTAAPGEGGADRSIADLLRAIEADGRSDPDGLDLYTALVDAWGPLTAPLLGRGGRTRVGVLQHLRRPSAEDEQQIDRLRALTARALVELAVDEARFIGSPRATSRHLVLAAARLVGRPELSDLRHLTLDLEDAETFVAGAPSVAAQPDDWFARGRRRRRVVASTAEMRGPRLVSIEAVDVRSTRTIVSWRLTHLATEPVCDADIVATDDVATVYRARVMGCGWERGQDGDEVFGESVLLPAVPVAASRLLIAAAGTLPCGRDQRFPGSRTPFARPVQVEVALDHGS